MTITTVTSRELNQDIGRAKKEANSGPVLMYLLGANVISELRKLGQGKADFRVEAWVSKREATSFHVSVLTLMEPEIGVLHIERRDVRQGERLLAWMRADLQP